jgi:DNA polymerase-1
MSIDAVYGPPFADCQFCKLSDTCLKERRFVTSSVGKDYRQGGLMIVGEFPERTDVQRGMPFSGRAGQLLDALLEEAGIDPNTVWKTLSLLGRPKDTTAKGLKDIDMDLYACLPRLDKEIEAARPRVIVALGQLPLDALTGETYEKRSLVDNPCDLCSPIDRKVGPVLQCFNGDCKHTVPVPDNARADEHAAKVWAQDWLAANEHKCPACATNMKRAKPKRIACPTCGGKKKREQIDTLFRCERVLTGRNGVVGAVFDAKELPGALPAHGVRYMVPTYAPNLLLVPMRDGAKGGKFLVGGQYAARATVDHLRKAKELLTREAQFNVIVHTTEGLPFDAAAKVIDDYTCEPGDFTVDIETNSRGGPWKTDTIVCIGIHRIGQEEALVVDTRLVGSAWNQGNPVIEALYRFMDSHKHGKVLHNGAYDRVVMARIWGFDLNGVISDTMVAHNACYPDEEHGLGFCAHELTDAPAWKGGHVTDKEFEAYSSLSGYRTFEELALYNARDLRATDLVWQKLQNRMLVERVDRVFESDTVMTELAIAMELAGLPLSQTALAKVDAEQSVEAANLLEEMRILTRKGDFVPSGGQLLWALYDPNGPCQLPVLATTATGQPSADRDALRAHAKHPFVQALLKHKVIEYNLSHFVRSPDLTVAEDGRLHPQWKVTGARTGRWTSKPNVQNWPKWMRTAFVAPPGRKIIGADQAQLEMRIVASLAGDPELIRRCATADENDKLNPECDPHSYVASLVFGEAFTKLDRFDTNHYKPKPGEPKCKCQKCRRSTLRDIVKRVVYGLNYGAGAQTVLDAIYSGGYDGPPLDIAFIERVVVIYFKAFPGIPTWREKTLKYALEAREIRSPILGRHRIFPLADVQPSVVYNYPIQSGGADIMALGLTPLMRELPRVDPSAVFIAQIHDAIYVECAEEHAPAVAKCIEQNMSFEYAFVEGAPPMPYVATASIGTNLAEV